LRKISPDLMPLDVFAYGYVRHVCAHKSLDVCDLRDNLWNAMNVEKNEGSGNLEIKILSAPYDRSKATGGGGMFQLFA